MVNTLDAFANALCCDSLEGLECILQYHYKKLKFLHKLVSSQSKFIDEIASDYDANTSLMVNITMSDDKAAKKLLESITNVSTSYNNSVLEYNPNPKDLLTDMDGEPIIKAELDSSDYVYGIMDDAFTIEKNNELANAYKGNTN